MIGEPIKQSAKWIGGPIKNTGKTGLALHWKGASATAPAGYDRQTWTFDMINGLCTTCVLVHRLPISRCTRAVRMQGLRYARAAASARACAVKLEATPDGKLSCALLYVGESLEKRIAEIIATGTCKQLELFRRVLCFVCSKFGKLIVHRQANPP